MTLVVVGVACVLAGACLGLGVGFAAGMILGINRTMAYMLDEHPELLRGATCEHVAEHARANGIPIARS